MNASLTDGAVFAARYRIVRRIAVGGMGAVYEAIHVETGRRRALKVMHPNMFQSEDLRERFKQEARIAARIESEHIVDVSDAGVDEATQTPFIVMELLRGEELSRRIKRAGPLAPAEAISCLHQMAMALDRTHAASIVHRDLKPENVFLCERDDGSVLVKILDFGVAKLVADGSAGATQSLGTPLYMAPEQFRSSISLTPAADIYALGLLAYTMLVGGAYWRKDIRSAGESFAFALIAALGPKQPPVERAAELGVSLPPAFDTWFARVTHFDPAQRIRPASEVVRTLAEVLGVAAPQKLGRAVSSSPVALATTSAGSRSGGLPRGDDAWPSIERTSTGASVRLARRGSGPRSILAVAAAGLAVALVLAAGAWLGRVTITTSPGSPAARSASADERAPANTASADLLPTVSPTDSAPPPASGSTSSAPAGPPPDPSAAGPATRAAVLADKAPRSAQQPPAAAATAKKPNSRLLGRD